MTTTTQTQILHRIRRQFGGDGAVVTPKDFLDLASRAAVDQALKRLVKKGDLTRLGRGLYHAPQMNLRLGITVPPATDQVVNAISRQTGSLISPTPQTVANQLGLSAQIPAKQVYRTTGSSRSIRVGNQTLRLKRAPAKSFAKADTQIGQALLAIEALGPDPDKNDVLALRARLDKRQRRQLVNKARYAVGWVAQTARLIAQDADPERLPSHG